MGYLIIVFLAASIMALNSAERETETQRAGRIQKVFRMGPCSPAVIPADTHLPGAHFQYGLRYRRQFISVGRVFNLMRRIGQGGKLPAVQPEFDPLSLCIGNLRPADTCTVSALLRQEVRRQVLRRPVFPDAQSCAFTAVDIVFLRPEPEKAHPVIAGISPSSFTGS